MPRPGLHIAVLALLSLLTVHAAAEGLHNDTRVFQTPMQMSRADFSDPAELQRTWNAALVRIPAASGASVSMTTAELADWRPGDGRKLPAVVYMHGCSGLWLGSRARVELMAEMGFVTVAPASLARRKYAQSCDPAGFRSGMYREVLELRQHDAAFALERVHELPFVDRDRVILMGLSEGAIVTATFRPEGPGQKIAARIIEGWTCHAGWPEYKGLHADEGEAVLSLLAANDPWFQAEWVRGDCGAWMTGDSGSLSVVYSDPGLEDRHELLEAEKPRNHLVAFLTSQDLLPR